MKNKMKTKLILTLGIILAIPLVLAMYSGDCDTIEFPNEDAVEWFVEGNSSNMNGFSYNKSGLDITYCFHPLYKPDNFTITFYNYQSIEVKSYEDPDSYYGGGYYTYPWRTNQTNETIINDTIDCEDDLCDLNQTIDITDSEPEKIGFWRRFWNWLKGVFGR